MQSKFEGVKGDVRAKYSKISKKVKDFEKEVKNEMDELKKETKEKNVSEA